MSSWLQLRPTFEIPLGQSGEEVLSRISEAHERAGRGPLMLLHGAYGELHLPESEHRLWSPHLSFHIHERQGQVVLLGRFAPRVNVWTVVWIFYLVFSFSAFFGLTIACSQWTLGFYPWGVWVVVASLAALAGLYLAANIGQQWSSDQMQELRRKLDSFLATAGIVVPTTTQAAPKRSQPGSN